MKIISNPWIAIDLGSERAHAAYLDPNGTVQNIVPSNHEFDSVFHVSQNTNPAATEVNTVSVGQNAIDQLDNDPAGIILLRTSLLKTDEPICLPDGRGEFPPSTLFVHQLRHLKNYCETHYFENRPIQSCVMALPHRHEMIRKSYYQIALEAGFSQVLFRDAIISAATTWKRVWDETSSFVIVCNLAASQVSFSLLQCRYGGCEHVRHFHSASTVGIDEIDRIILLSQDSDSQIVSVEKWEDMLRLKMIRRNCNWDKNETFRIIQDGRLRRIRTEHFTLAANIVAKKIRWTFKHFAERAKIFTKQDSIPVLLIGGGTNIPIIIEAIEEIALGKVYWWAEAEEAVVIGTAEEFLPKQKPDNTDSLALHFHQLYMNADAGDRESQYYLGKSLEAGHGTPISLEKAVDWYRLSAQNGYLKAKYRLAKLLFQGLGTIFHRNEALQYLQESAEEGYVLSQYLLGRYLYENTDDAVSAEHWIRKSADQNHPEALAYYEKHFRKE
ncbi:MAG: sel1 repeat family protein [Planctomycetaceae bacterium]|jgi:molecular chaperone DnaK (HSP70)|nr:sel1 repeat family protein [Planctomycetaceae bacterium]